MLRPVSCLQGCASRIFPGLRIATCERVHLKTQSVYIRARLKPQFASFFSGATGFDAKVGRNEVAAMAKRPG